MNVGIFYNSISNPAKFSNKVMLMDNFKQGVINSGDTVIEFRDNTLSTVDDQLTAGFVLGYTLEENFRRKIINNLRTHKVPQIFVDSNILHYSRKEHEWHRYSMNGVYPTDGIYFFDNLNLEKWNTYSTWHGAELKPWRVGHDDQHILVLCQRPKGWNMFGNDQDAWLEKIFSKINKLQPNRPVRVRMHPGDGTRFKQIEKLQKRYGNSIQISTAGNIREDLVNCWCSVGYNSTPNVVSAIEGVPVYLEDSQHSWARDIGFTDIAQIANPPLPDRSQWVHQIANIHWSNDEVRSGQLWQAIRRYILSSR